MTSFTTVGHLEAHEVGKALTSMDDIFGDSGNLGEVGLLGEFAIVKYFNYDMCSREKVEFNTSYVGGGDGGYDFEIKGVKFDAKTLPNDGAKGWIVRKTKSHIVVFSRFRMETDRGYIFKIMGWMPASVVGQMVYEHDLRPMRELQQNLPVLFFDKSIRRGKPVKIIKRIGATLKGQYQAKQLKEGKA